MLKPKVRIYQNCPITSGLCLELDRSQSHYVANVMRVRTTDYLLIFNGKQGEWLAQVISSSNNKVQIRLLECVKEQRSSVDVMGADIMLIFSLVKHSALSNIIRQATEMGASVIQPIISEYTVNRQINLDKMCLLTIEAAEQCGRLDIPPVYAPIDFCSLKDLQRTLLLCDESKKGSTSKVLPHTGCVGVIVGPEGGFSPRELEFASSFCHHISLGRYILRADTAVVTALAYVMAMTD